LSGLPTIYGKNGTSDHFCDITGQKSDSSYIVTSCAPYYILPTRDSKVLAVASCMVNRVISNMPAIDDLILCTNVDYSEIHLETNKKLFCC